MKRMVEKKTRMIKLLFKNIFFKQQQDPDNILFFYCHFGRPERDVPGLGFLYRWPLISPHPPVNSSQVTISAGERAKNGTLSMANKQLQLHTGNPHGGKVVAVNHHNHHQQQQQQQQQQHHHHHHHHHQSSSKALGDQWRIGRKRTTRLVETHENSTLNFGVLFLQLLYNLFPLCFEFLELLSCAKERHQTLVTELSLVKTTRCNKKGDLLFLLQ